MERHLLHRDYIRGFLGSQNLTKVIDNNTESLEIKIRYFLYLFVTNFVVNILWILFRLLDSQNAASISIFKITDEGGIILVLSLISGILLICALFTKTELLDGQTLRQYYSMGPFVMHKKQFTLPDIHLIQVGIISSENPIFSVYLTTNNQSKVYWCRFHSSREFMEKIIIVIASKIVTQANQVSVQWIEKFSFNFIIRFIFKERVFDPYTITSKDFLEKHIEIPELSVEEFQFNQKLIHVFYGVILGICNVMTYLLSSFI